LNVHGDILTQRHKETKAQRFVFQKVGVFAVVLSLQIVAFCEDFGARLSQPQHFRLPTDAGQQLDAFVCIFARCGWDSRAPVWLRLGRFKSLR
jgi:hypothetical protein